MSKRICKFIIVFEIIFIGIIFFYIILNNKIDELSEGNYIDVIRISNQTVTQGDVVVYEIENKIDKDIDVEIINSVGNTIEKATVKDNKILVDTSLLMAGSYNIKILYDSHEIISEYNFIVILIIC
jgi:hypothetical protein